jgi:S-adenosylmethionine:tRNA ribosyltransferase-isomerase
MHPKDISISGYTYPLPDERIAVFPLPERDSSKLLIYKNGDINQDIYKNIASYIPENSLLVFNNTKVIQARILFKKTTGGVIEIFCLEPYELINEYSSIMSRQGSVCWKCMIGGAGKWKEGPLLKHLIREKGELSLKAKLVEKLSDAYVVELSWLPAHLSFAEVIDLAGNTPLPPYIKRTPEVTDKGRYQTIYAKYDGSVAAPTAGLHFTENIFTAFEEKKISNAYVTLHVGAGTFKPVKAAAMEGHEMHAEWIDVSLATIEQLLFNMANTIIAVGSTSVRTIESLYWMGVKAILFPETGIGAISIHQWDVYEMPLLETDFSAKEALNALLGWMQKNKQERIITTTQILICPGYQYKVAKAIITNFHQPQSTLLLLVAAAVGNDWKRIYNYAMQNDFRFLSYGDGSLLFMAQ